MMIDLRCGIILMLLLGAVGSACSAVIETSEEGRNLLLSWRGDEQIRIIVDREKGILQAPVEVRVGDKSISFNGFYVHLNGVENGFETKSPDCSIQGDHIVTKHTLHHPRLPNPATLTFDLWMEPQDRGLRVRVMLNGDGVHLDRLGIGDYSGAGIRAERMFFGRMYVMDDPKAFEHRHDWFTCRFWLRRMANGLCELQATDGTAKGFHYDPKEKFDLFTYCQSPVNYLFFFSGKDPQEIIAEYRNTITIPPPPALDQLPGRVGVLTNYPIEERYEDFLEEWTGRGACDFVWNAYQPTPGDREKVEPFGALYAVYDTYFDAFMEGPRRMEGLTPEMVEYDENGDVVPGYWYAPRVLPNLYVEFAQSRKMGLLGREYRNEQGERAWMPNKASRYSNLKITREEVNPSALYIDVHLSKLPYHYYDHEGKHHSTSEFWAGQKDLIEFAREFMNGIPIWAEGGAEDYIGLMDGGWFLENRSLEERGVESARWQYYPFLEQVHRERVLNMGVYFPLEHYDVEQVNAAVLLGRPQAISVYFNSSQEDVGGRLMVYYMTKAFHQMLGLSRLDRVEFVQDDIDRQIVSYSNGAHVWCNRSTATWEVEGMQLPPMGWLVKGTDGFIEYRALKDGEPVDVVRSEEYDLFASQQLTDFGPIELNGALAMKQSRPDRLVLYEIRKPKGIVTLRLDECLDSDKRRRAVRVWACMTRDRRLELKFPDWRQLSDPQNSSQLGNVLELRPVEMRNVLRYEIEFEEV